MSAVADTDFRYTALLEAAAEPAKVSTLTHGFYRYPARFGELFVRQAIAAFSAPGDLVVDPFCGGGTTVVEGLVAGRRVVATDLSPLALFIAKVKSTPLREEQLAQVRRWLAFVTASVGRLLLATDSSRDARLHGTPGKYKNLLANLVDLLELLPLGETRNFARAVLLKASQWALDGKELVPTPTQFVQRLHLTYEDMAQGMLAYVGLLREKGLTKSDITHGATLLQCSADNVSSACLGTGGLADLVVTSPPYLGVHVLYNKWQVGGRRETRLPFYLADVDDPRTASGYTLISRSSKRIDRYFDAIQKCFASVADCLAPHGYVIQLVSFANADEALPQYLAALRNAGLELCDVYVSHAGELRWRTVPSRRWYVRVRAVNDSSAAKEVLLIHRKRG